MLEGDTMAEKRKRKLYRVEDGLVGGVCAGLAECYDVDIVVPRILAVLIVLVTFGLGTFAYLILWIRLPERAAQPASDPYDVRPDYVGSDTHGALAASLGALSAQASADGPRRSTTSLVARVAAAVLLAVLFLVVAAMVPPLLPGSEWWQFWPVALLVAGVFLVIIPIRSDHEMAWHVIGIVITSFAAMALPMSLDIVSWNSVPHAFGALWFLIVAGGVMLVIGVVRNEVSFMIGGAVCVALFCLFTLLFLSLPGNSTTFVIIVPENSLRFIGL